MLTLPCPVRIFLYVPPMDMRCGMARLSMVAESYLQQDPYSGHFFVYFNKRGDKCKILYWTGRDSVCGTSGWSGGRLSVWPRRTARFGGRWISRRCR